MLRGDKGLPGCPTWTERLLSVVDGLNQREVEFITFLSWRVEEFTPYIQAEVGGGGKSWEFIGIKRGFASERSLWGLQGKCPFIALGLTKDLGTVPKSRALGLN